MGRPMKKWTAADKKLFEDLCAIMCTRDEVCSVMHMSTERLAREIKEAYPDTPTFTEVFPLLSGAGRANLRRQQFKEAMNGSIPMLIFLGKNYLGQSDMGVKTEREPRENRVIAFQRNSPVKKAMNG